MSEIVEKKIIFKTIVKPWGEVTVTIDVDDGPVKTPQVV